jgi:uncharacterized membrane protein YbhN (UPF0104 family)
MMARGQFLPDSVCPRRLVAGGLAALALAVLAAIFLPGTVADALDKLADADRGWLLLGVVSLLASSIASSGIWHEGMGAAGRRASFGDACARYWVGSLVNSFTPGRLGELVRIGLFAKTVPEDGRAWSAGGGVAAVVAARAVATGVVLCAAVALGAVPFWVAGTLLAIGAAGIGTAVLARHRFGLARLERLLAAFRTLGRDPRRSARLLAWALAAAAARILALAAIAASLGVPSAFVVAFILMPALDLAGLVSLTPGNVGISSGMTAVALASHGIGLQLGLSAGIAVHAAETAVGLGFGLAGALALAPMTPLARRRLVVSVGAAASAAAFLALAFELLPGIA